MITQFKIFENLNVLPQVGDYVLIDEKKLFSNSVKVFYNFFLSNPIGQIANITTEHGGSAFLYYIKFENVPEDVIVYFNNNDGIKKFSINYFKVWSKNKKDIEISLKEKKYNI